MTKGKVLRLLSDEIQKLYPGMFTFSDEFQYNIHCSKIFAEHLHEDFLSIGFQIPITFSNGEEVDLSRIQITKYQIPIIGRLNILTDMEQGYKIEKV